MTETNANPKTLTVADDPAAAAADMAEAAAGLRDIKPPVDLPIPWEWWLIGAAVALAVAGLVYWHIRRRRAKRRYRPAGEGVLPPHVRARNKLFSAITFINDPKAFCVLVSDTVRVYIEEQFELRAPELTTEEFLHELKDNPVLGEEHNAALSEFLATCDLAKFAKHEPERTELEAIHTLAHKIVHDTGHATIVTVDET